MDSIREIVSSGRQRYRDGVYNLDLTYIYPRVIAMGFPSSGFEGAYRNHINQVASFLNERHGENFKVYNLSCRKYDYTKFGGRVIELGWPDHHSPPLHFAWTICQSMISWLRQDERHIVAVHCMAGKGRTGVIIGCLSVLTGHALIDEAIAQSISIHRDVCKEQIEERTHVRPDDIIPPAEATLRALSFFEKQRGQGVEQPSQRRVVMCFARVLCEFLLQKLDSREADSSMYQEVLTLTSTCSGTVSELVLHNFLEELWNRRDIPISSPPCIKFKSLVLSKVPQMQTSAFRPCIQIVSVASQADQQSVFYNTAWDQSGLVNGCNTELSPEGVIILSHKRSVAPIRFGSIDHLQSYSATEGHIGLHIHPDSQSDNICGDVMIRCLHMPGATEVFRVAFHTSFLRYEPAYGVFRLNKWQLDIKSRKTNHKRFPDDFHLDIFYEAPSVRDADVVPVRLRAARLAMDPRHKGVDGRPRENYWDNTPDFLSSSAQPVDAIHESASQCDHDSSSPQVLGSCNSSTDSSSKKMDYHKQRECSPSSQRTLLPKEQHEANVRRTGSEVTCVGWLTKRGALVRNWKRRWFALRHRILSYYENDASAKALGHIAISDCCGVAACPSEEANGRQYAFKLIHKDRVYVLSAPTQPEMEQWIKSIALVHASTIRSAC